MTLRTTLALVSLTTTTIACGSSPPPAPPAPPAPPEEVAPAAVEDPYLWLEDVGGDASLTWVKAQNARSTAELEKVPGFDALRGRIRAILDSKVKIPWVGKRGKHLYNLWTDDVNPRGLWRRTTLVEYRKAAPKWEVLIDLDALGKAEGESWVWHGAECLYPKYERCLVSLSRGGADADVVREFDITKKAFVAGGFTLPEAKNIIGWKDLDAVYVGTDFGPGSLTDSGYPRIAKLWKRGTPPSEATTVIEGKPSDIWVYATRQWDQGKVRDLAGIGTTFFTDEAFVIADGTPKKVDKPAEAELSFWKDQALLRLKSAWTIEGTTWPAGALLTMDEGAFLAGDRKAFTALFTPRANSSLIGAVGLHDAFLVNELEDVRNKLFQWRRDKTGAWQREAITVAGASTLSVSAWDSDDNNDYWLIEDDFTTPSTLALVRGGKREVLKRAPSFFEAGGLEVSQHFVASADGTRVPYFQVARKGIALDGSHPTLIEGYGGFEISLTPEYDAAVGAAWLERGGVYVVPNIRGGGEYGPQWHQAALKLNRQRAYDDFAAVAQDLIARGVTKPEKLGITGGSNGGLLVGVMMTQRPELFGAVVCKVPLLDMKRYSVLLAGASWVDEYGDPNVAAEWDAIAKYSPYHNVEAGVRYPRVLFTTSTRDDRVHPGHARKMVARMLELEHDVIYYENLEGGHGGAADNAQRAYLAAIAYAFLWQQLGVDGEK